jgi:hypothetical protein
MLRASTVVSLLSVARRQYFASQYVERLDLAAWK